MNRALALRIAACGIMGLGAALLIAAVLLSTYTAGKIGKVPLDIDATLASDGSGAALKTNDQETAHAVVDDDVPLVSQQQISVESPADADLVTLQVGTSVRRTDLQKDNGLLLAIVDTVTLDRDTALAASDDATPAGSVQEPRNVEDDKPPTSLPLTHEGLSYRFPFHTEKETYPYFDPIAQRAFDADFEDEEDVNGLTTYRFTQNVGYDADGKLVKPIRYPSLYAHDEDGEITAPAWVWGLETDDNDRDDDVTMTRFYASKKTFWVDPVSGTIVKSEDHANHYYAREPLKPELTLVDYTIVSDEETVEAQVSAARDERDRLALWSRVLPITFTAGGAIMLIAGMLLGWFGVRTEPALVDPAVETTNTGFFEGLFGTRHSATGKVGGADAETEKLSMPGSERDRPPDKRSGGEGRSERS